MKRVYYERPEAAEIVDVAVPEPAPGEVRLRTHITGLCGTDLHLHEGAFFPSYPLTPGHEVVGEVDALGDGVSTPGVGELVALNNLVTCGTCDNCRRARPAYCRTLRALGVTEPGGFAEYVVAPAGQCHPADGMPAERLVFAEPLACAFHGLDVLNLPAGSDVLLFGAGPTGLLLAQLLRGDGAARLTVVAPTEFKLELAAAYGADHTLQVQRGDSAALVEGPRKIAPDGFDLVVDATGALDVQRQGLALTRDGGTFFIYGMAPEEADLPIRPYEVFRRELSIKGSFAQAFTFDRALLALRTGRVRVDDMITHTFGLDHYLDAIDTLRNDRSCLKVVTQF